MRVNNLRAVYAAWLNDSENRRTGVGMNRFARGEVNNDLSGRTDKMPRYI